MGVGILFVYSMCLLQRSGEIGLVAFVRRKQKLTVIGDIRGLCIHATTLTVTVQDQLQNSCSSVAVPLKNNCSILARLFFESNSSSVNKETLDQLATLKTRDHHGGRGVDVEEVVSQRQLLFCLSYK